MEINWTLLDSIQLGLPLLEFSKSSDTHSGSTDYQIDDISKYFATQTLTIDANCAP